MTEVVKPCHHLTWSQKKHNKKREVPLKITALDCLISLVPKYFIVQSKEELKTENCLSTFVIAGVANTEIFMSFIKLAFYKQIG